MRTGGKPGWIKLPYAVRSLSGIPSEAPEHRSDPFRIGCFPGDQDVHIAGEAGIPVIGDRETTRQCEVDGFFEQ